jgi:RNA polymerase sigma factor (sigma-70 family)
MKLLKSNELVEFWDQFIYDGSLDSLSKIYFHYYDHLFDYGMRLTSNRQAVEDAIQNGFMNFIKGRENIGDVKNLPGYLISTFRRQLFNDLNKQKKMIPSESLPEEHFDYFKNSEQPICDKKDLERVYSTVRQCISKLTEKQKEIIYLRFEREMSYEEISKMLDITVDSCYKSVYRTINTIRKEAEEILGKDVNVVLFFMQKTIAKKK